MKTISISGTKRAEIGKKNAKALRNSGQVPCVLYGGKEQIHFSALEKDFKHLVYTPDAHLVKIDLGGTQFDAILQDIQFHKIKESILHIDFLQLESGKPVVMNIPVKLKGNAKGVREGGRLLKKMRTLKVKAVADKLPDNIELDITALEIGDSIHVGDIKIDGVTFLDAAKNTVVGVRVTRVVVEETPAAAAATTEATPAAGATTAAPAADAKAGDKKEEKKDEKKK